MVSVSGSEISVLSSTTTNAIICDVYTSIIKKIVEKNSDEDVQKLKKGVSEKINCDIFCMLTKLSFSE